jgi:AraC-like DNA-binding protein
MTVDRGVSATSSWEMVARRPRPGFEAVVADYGGYREEGTTPVGRREVPNRGLVLVIGFGGPLRVSGQLGADEGGQTVTSFVAGFGDLPILTEHAGWQQGIEVGLSPTGAFSLLGVPMVELANRVVGLDELWGRRAVELSEQLAEAPSWEARFELVDGELADAMDDAMDAGRYPDPEIVGAWQELERRRGDVPIGEIQAATGWSRRRLAARFREQVGLTPKAAARVLRFDRAAELLVRPAPRSLASIALSCGYYDQAHFNREFRRLAGCTPSAYLAALYPDAPGVAAAPIATTQTSKTPQLAHS